MLLRYNLYNDVCYKSSKSLFTHIACLKGGEFTEDMPLRYHMNSDKINRPKSSTTHWRVTRNG